MGASTSAVLADTPDEQWAFASGLYDQKLWGLAAENLQKFVAANPRHPRAAQASYQLAAAILRNSEGGKIDYAAGAAAYEKALKQFPDPKLAGPAAFDLANAYFNLGKYELAASNYARFLATKPAAEQAAEAAYWRGESLYSLKKAAEARAAYTQVLEAYPNSRSAPYAALALGTLAEEGGQMGAAATAYARVWQKYPKSEAATEARLRGANALLGLSRWKEASAAFEAVLAEPSLAKWKRTALEGIADAHFGQKSWREAAAAYERALAEPAAKDAPASPEASLRVRLADSLFNAKDWARAAEAYAPLVSSTDAKVAANALYFRGRALDEAGRKDEAARDYESLIARFPAHGRSPRAALLLGDLKSEAKDPAAAAQAYRAVIAKFPKSKEAADAQASLVALANGLVERSTSSSTSTSTSGDAPAGATGAPSTSSAPAVPDALENVLRALPPGRAASNARERLARAAYDRGEWDSAAALAQQALDSQPDKATRENALYLLGSSHLYAERPSQAAAAFQKLLAAGPSSSLAPSAHLGLAWAMLDQKKWPEAAAAARAGLARVASSTSASTSGATAAAKSARADLRARLQLALGEAQWNAKSYAPASVTLASLSSADKEVASHGAWLAASSFESLKKWKEAAVQWSRYASSAAAPADQARGHLRRGLALLKAGDAASKAAAQAAFDRAVTLDPKGESGARALYERAWAATEAKSAGAGALWERLSREFPESKFAATAAFQSAEALFAAKKWDEAAAAYETVAQKWAQSEEAPAAWYQRGAALFNAKRWSEAAAAFERAAAFPKSDTAQESLFWAGESYAKAGDLKAARPHFEKFLATATASTSSTSKPSVQMSQWISAARLGLGRALIEGAEPARAEAVLRQAVSGAGAGAEANFRLAQALEAQSKWREAAAQSLKVSTLYPRSEWAAQAAWMAAQATDKSGDKEAATALYRAIAEANPPGQHAAAAKERLQVLGGAQ